MSVVKKIHIKKKADVGITDALERLTKISQDIEKYSEKERYEAGKEIKYYFDHILTAIVPPLCKLYCEDDSLTLKLSYLERYGSIKYELDRKTLIKTLPV